MWELVVDLARWVQLFYFILCTTYTIITFYPVVLIWKGFVQYCNSISCLPAGGWWWLWCVLHNCRGKPHHIPHFQQVLLPWHSKSTKWEQCILWIYLYVLLMLYFKTQHSFSLSLSLSLSLLLSFCVTCRTHTGLVSTFGRPCLISKHFSSLKMMKRRWWSKQSMDSWKMGKSSYNRHCGMVCCIWLTYNLWVSFIKTKFWWHVALFAFLVGHIVGAGHSTLSEK